MEYCPAAAATGTTAGGSLAAVAAETVTLASVSQNSDAGLGREST